MKRAVFCLCVLTIGVLAQAPINDGCASPAGLTPGDLFGTLVGATTDAGNFGCATVGVKPDVWYVFNRPTSVRLTVVADSSVFQPIVAIYTGTCGALTAVACGGASVTLVTTPNVNYLVRVTSATSSLGVFKLSTFAEVLATNDDCSGALPIHDGLNPGVGESGYLFSNVGATNSSVFADTCAGAGHPGGRDVFFVYTATCAAATIDTCTPNGFLPGSLENTIVSIYPITACVPSGPPPAALACNDNGDCQPGSSRVSFHTTPGTQYLVRVSSFVTASSGSFYLTVHGAATFSAGPGCGLPGLGSPQLRSSTPVTGEFATIRVSGFSPNSPGGLFIAYCLGTPVSVNGCPLYLDTSAVNFELVAPFVTDSQGAAVFSGLVPAIPEFQCKFVCTQAAVIANSVFSSLQLSNGLAVYFGG